MRSVLLIACLAAVALAQDPAPGWLGYAVATCPAGTKVTSMSGYWKVGAKARPSSSFYSPWFGIDTTDNLNLLQPVNPWFGESWVLYTEYFQWEPEHNQNSDSVSVRPGDMLHGEIKYLGDKEQAYQLSNTDTASGRKSGMKINVQRDSSYNYKNYTYLYVVYEKVAPCRNYPPDGKVRFTNITVYCNGELYSPQWKTAYVEDVCNNRAHVIDPNTIEISWDTKGRNPTPEQLAQNTKVPRFTQKH